MLSRFYLIPERYGQTDGQTDGRTDRQNCYINIARQCADARLKWYVPVNVLSGNRLSGKRLFRETSVLESSCPGNVFSVKRLSWNRLSGKRLFRESDCLRNDRTPTIYRGRVQQLTGPRF